MKIVLDIDDKNLKAGFKDFKNMNPIAVRNTLNVAAALSRRNAIAEVKKDFTLRNTFTVRNIQFDQATGRDIKKMKSRVGATKAADYMETQEFGGRRRMKGKGAAIPMKSARRGGSEAKPVKKSVYINKIANRRVKGRVKRNGTRDSNFVAMAAVSYRKKKFIRRGRNIFSVKSFNKTGRNNVRFELVHLYKIDKGPIIVKKEPWLKPAIKKPARDIEPIYKSQLKKLWKSKPESLK